jgi:hypothetical protein
MESCFNCENSECRTTQITIYNLSRRPASLNTYLKETSCDDWKGTEKTFEDVGDGTMTNADACK